MATGYLSMTRSRFPSSDMTGLMVSPPISAVSILYMGWSVTTPLIISSLPGCSWIHVYEVCRLADVRTSAECWLSIKCVFLPILARVEMWTFLRPLSINNYVMVDGKNLHIFS